MGGVGVYVLRIEEDGRQMGQNLSANEIEGGKIRVH